MVEVNKETFIYSFAKDAEVAATVSSGSTVRLETYDAFTNQVTDEKSTYDAIDWASVNPATGPIYVEGAEPGDRLRVRIEKIELAPQGVMAVSPDLGVLGDEVESFETRVMEITEEGVQFNDAITIPLRKMIGVIGVAPKGEAVPCGTPGDHGGNMDNTKITEGATLYFPVEAPGALFALGDIHAAMGDGEVGVTGVEAAAHVTVTLSVEKKAVHLPWLEDEQSVSVISSGDSFQACVKRAVKELASHVRDHSSLSYHEAIMLLSASADVEVCQVVNPLLTVRMTISKDMLRQAGVGLLSEMR
ncbi:acetamidase/formamidase family protein [Shouchella shacheensis]|uniref:acetamidase/formamidase family protein n=1 Tax=Shouchella shacheensis TaxID=1649580 RepID=UPI00073FC232|nr:acetamidase/formamidase family protein [Shouchella shacheensis]